MPQPALIFDFGNVVAHFDYTRSCDRLGKRIGLTGKELLARATSDGFSEILKRYESGQMPAEAFSRQVCRLVGLDDLPHHEFAREWADI
ncbi:MAG TPA: HAD family phosphatase, partial [Isosphaeraceae bacterium]|nr:HAD family phosphatase [Isosphaeraceae bacterium]